MNIQKRGAGLTLLLILIVGAAAAAATWWEDQSITRLIDAHTLQSMQSIQRFAESSQRRELELKTAILASNPGFVGYISQAISSGAESGGVVDAASIRDLLEERRNDNAFDAAAILDPAGKTLVMLGNSLRTQQDFSATSLWTRFRASTAPTIDLISYNGHLILVSLSPMLRGETLEAVLLTGVEVADSFVVPVARAGQVDLALIGVAAGGNTVIASTLGAEDHQVVLDAVAAEPSLPPAGGDSALRRDFDLRLSAGPAVCVALKRPAGQHCSGLGEGGSQRCDPHPHAGRRCRRADLHRLAVVVRPAGFAASARSSERDVGAHIAR